MIQRLFPVGRNPLQNQRYALIDGFEYLNIATHIAHIANTQGVQVI